MAGLVHDTMVVLLKEHPEWLDAVLGALAGVRLPPGLTLADSAQRKTDAVEVRGDLLFVAGTTGPWFLLEVQLAIDEAKARKWPLMAALLLDERGTMGDLVVLTPHAHVAAWARTVSHTAGMLGTHLAVSPVVVLLDGDHAETFLDPARPELAFFAVWTMQDRHGPTAKAVVDRAFALVDAVASAELRALLVRAMYNVLSEPLAQTYREMLMDLQSLPESPAMRSLRESLEVRGAATSLLTVLAARGFAFDEATRQRVEACTDMTTLQRWIQRAIQAPSLAEVFAPAQ
jgi:hypothetical protein